MQFEQYSVQADRTAIYPNRGNNLMYPILGLVGEVGETCENVKKVIRDRNGDFDEETLKLIQKELGDVLWYLNALSFEFICIADRKRDIKNGIDFFSLSAIACENLRKLSKRREDGKLHGSGDTR